jgi:hypothetical protein
MLSALPNSLQIQFLFVSAVAASYFYNTLREILFLPPRRRGRDPIRLTRLQRRLLFGCASL